MTIRALLLHSDPDELLPWLRANCERADWRAASDRAAIARELREHRPSAVFSIKHNALPGPLHAVALAAESVEWFHVGGSGREHLGPWDPDRVTVTTSAGLLAPFLAERALAALLSLATGLPEFARAQAARRWAPTTFRPVAGRTLLVVGFGHTGREFARRARSLGMYVIGVRASGAVSPDADEMHTPSGLAALLPRADVVSLHVPANPATQHLLDRDALYELPDHAILLNASRGAVVDTSALVVALESGRLAGAWVDVFEQEPLPAEHALWSFPNVIVTPHCADQAEGWPVRFAERFAENWLRRARGDELLGVVAP